MIVLLSVLLGVAIFYAIQFYLQLQGVEKALEAELVVGTALNNALIESTKTLQQMSHYTNELTTFGHNTIWQYGDKGGIKQDKMPSHIIGVLRIEEEKI